MGRIISLISLLAALFIGVAHADYLVQQPNGQWTIIKAYVDATGAQQQNVSTEGQKTTYSFAFGPQTSFAVAATDWITVTGSATKTVRVGKLSVCGTATAATTVDVLLIKRSTADTGGTISSTPTAVPNDSGNAAATAVVVSYSANPTLGTTVGNVDVKKWNVGAAGGAGCVFWQWGDTNGQQIVLRGVTQQLAVNLNGVAPTAGASFDAKVELTEE